MIAPGVELPVGEKMYIPIFLRVTTLDITITASTFQCALETGDSREERERNSEGCIALDESNRAITIDGDDTDWAAVEEADSEPSPSSLQSVIESRQE